MQNARRDAISCFTIAFVANAATEKNILIISEETYNMI